MSIRPARLAEHAFDVLRRGCAGVQAGMVTVTKFGPAIIADGVYAMLLTPAKFKLFTNKQVADAHKTTEVLTCLAVESRARVDEIVRAAVEAGGSEPRPPQDHGFMFARSFDDLDGHIWEIVWMDPQAMAQAGG